MLIFLYGQDTYRSRQKLKEIIEHYKKIHQSGLNLIYLDGQNLKFTDLKNILQQVSMFNEKKLVVLQNVFDNQDFKEKFLKNYKNFFETKPETKAKLGAGDVILLYEESKIPENDRLLKLLKKQKKVQEFQFLEGEKLKNWAKQEFSKFKTKISPEALNKIVDFVGNDLWRFSNEIKKLVFFKKEGEINAQDVELLIEPKIETAIFKTIDAISQKDKKRALLLIHQHLAKGDHPLYLLSMINFQFRNILIIKDLIEKNRPYYSILKETRFHPFVVKKSCQQARKFTLQELKKIYQKIFEVDLNIKTGKINPEAALDLLIAEI